MFIEEKQYRESGKCHIGAIGRINVAFSRLHMEYRENFRKATIGGSHILSTAKGENALTTTNKSEFNITAKEGFKLAKRRVTKRI